MTERTTGITLITGAAGAVGSTTARLLAARGARLALTDRHPERLQQLVGELGPTPLLLERDLSAPGASEALFDELVAKAGRIDAVIHTVGGIDPAWPRLSETSDEALRRLLELNLVAAFQIGRAAARVMHEGSLVFVSSRGGLSPAGGGAYDISKAALTAMISVLAADLKERGLRVNGVAPSIILTEANRRAMPAADTSRWVTPEQVAEALLYLASPASSGTTGVVLPVYGGL